MRVTRYSLFFLAVAAVALLATAAPAAAQTSRIDATVNNTTYEATPTTVYKNTNFTLVQESVHFYSRFAWESVIVEEALLYFYLYSGSASATVTAYGVSSSYNADTLTWATQPAAGAVIGSVNVTGVGWWAIDVSSYLNNSGDSFSIFLVNSSGGNNVVRSLPAVDHIYIDYSTAVATKPTAPVHCWDMEDELDKVGSYHLTNNGVSLGEYSGVWDGNMTMTNTTSGSATVLPLHTANNDFTIATFAKSDIDSTFTLDGGGDGWLFGRDAGGFSLCEVVGGDCLYSYLEDFSWTYFGGSIAADGSAALYVNQTDVYTDTLTLVPTANNYVFSLSSNTAATNTVAVDQMFYFDYVLSTEEHRWLWNGGRGRSCYEFGNPTQITVTIPIPTPAYTSTLPNGSIMGVHATATVGDVGIGSFLIFNLLLSGWWITRQIVRPSAEKKADD